MVPGKRLVLICFHDRMNLGLRVLSAKLRKAGHQVALIFLKDERAAFIQKPKENALQYQILSLDKFIGCGEDINPVTPKEWDLLSSLIKDIRPNIIGVSSRSVHNGLAFRTVQILKGVAPDAIFIAGGYGPTLEPHEYLLHFDYICIGEGDNALVPFVESDSPRFSPNIAFLENDKVICNSFLPPGELDKLPYPDLSPDNKFMIEDDEIKTGENFSHTEIYDVMASRGCVSSCTYCLACHWNTMLKPYGVNFPKVSLRSPDSVIDELKFAKNNYGIKSVRFKDSIFGFDEKWLFKFMDLYDNNIGLKFHCFLDVRYSSESVIKRLHKSGLGNTTVGIQSANEKIRREIFNRNISDEEIINYTRMLLKNEIQVKYELINWNPFENHISLENGLHFLTRLPKANRITILELKIFPGSLLKEKYLHEKPVSLSKDEYSFWAILQVMVLFSEKTEAAASSLLKKSNRDIDDTSALFRNYLYGSSDKYKITATTNIKKGDRIKPEQVFLKTSSREGIPSYEKDKVIGLIAKNNINAKEVIYWKDVYSTYEGVSTL
jgi:radical SAM superfamily enzyme YgiQ (UPF0313 family)